MSSSSTTPASPYRKLEAILLVLVLEPYAVLFSKESMEANSTSADRPSVSAPSYVVQYNFTQSPMHPYVGDAVVLSYSFKDYTKLVPIAMGKNRQVAFNLGELLRGLRCDKTLCEAVSCAIVALGEDGYRLDLTIVPWQVGSIEIGAIDLAGILGIEGSPLILETKEFTCYSLLGETDGLGGETGKLRGSRGLLLMPGSLTLIYIAIVGFALSMFIIVTVLVHLRSILGGMVNFVLYIRLAYLSYLTLKALAFLRANKEGGDDTDFALRLQDILRGYLSARYDRDFYTVETSRLYMLFSKDLAFELLDSSMLDSVENLESLMLRLDYIRYAKGSIDSKRLPEATYSTTLSPMERQHLIANAIAFILWSRACLKGLKIQ